MSVSSGLVVGLVFGFGFEFWFGFEFEFDLVILWLVAQDLNRLQSTKTREPISNTSGRLDNNRAYFAIYVSVLLRVFACINGSDNAFD